jgi:hypothetical protein
MFFLFVCLFAAVVDDDNDDDDDEYDARCANFYECVFYFSRMRKAC